MPRGSGEVPSYRFFGGQSFILPRSILFLSIAEIEDPAEFSWYSKRKEGSANPISRSE